MSEKLARNPLVELLGTPDRTEGSLNSPVELEENGISYNEKWLYEHLREDPAGVPIRAIYWHRYDFMGTLVRETPDAQWRADDKLAAALTDKLDRLAPGLSAHPPTTPSNRHRAVSEVKNRTDLGGYAQDAQTLKQLTDRDPQR
ncbi:MAG: hypothetical protein ACREQN_10030 [Candidatus Binataceae bacterium]